MYTLLKLYKMYMSLKKIIQELVYYGQDNSTVHNTYVYTLDPVTTNAVMSHIVFTATVVWFGLCLI